MIHVNNVHFKMRNYPSIVDIIQAIWVPAAAAPSPVMYKLSASVETHLGINKIVKRGRG